ncbi:hypothetical protein [Streptomyces parvus]|uniref:hypothetical protein n=1 Tax=Streptomyces parvus TaxID=66428 RepID=UPI00210160BC|nr:hypothetical protein [Streptomyces parvus]MCQ1575351.1 hypothetical protein [Streptomyces parvus]
MSAEVAAAEYVYGIDSSVSDDDRFYRDPHVVRFRIIKRTPKRIYYIPENWGRPVQRFVDRVALERDGQVRRRSAGWWEPDATVYLNPPELQQHAKPDLAGLRAEMAAAHPDRGGTDAAFIVARQRYEQAREAAA